MTNKGSKFLQLELDKSRFRCKALDRQMNETHIKLLDVNKINKVMEADLLSVCNGSLWKAFWKLIKLRRDLKKRMKQRRPAVTQQQIDSAREGMLKVSQ